MAVNYSDKLIIDIEPILAHLFELVGPTVLDNSQPKWLTSASFSAMKTLSSLEPDLLTEGLPHEFELLGDMTYQNRLD